MKLSDFKIYLSELTDEYVIRDMYKTEARIGAKKLIGQRLKQLERDRLERLNYQTASAYEDRYAGHIICGIDEVGRGPLAGPVVACAVILEEGHYYPGLTDSKKLSREKRQDIEQQLLESVRDYAIGMASVEEIDAINIYEASKLAMRRAVQGLSIQPTVLLIDAMKLETGLVEESIIKGDEKSVSIGAASIIAKEYRDRLMASYDREYSGYDFKNNAGYGTKKHLEGLRKLGITPIHRQTFEPVKSMIIHH